MQCTWGKTESHCVKQLEIVGFRNILAKLTSQIGCFVRKTNFCQITHKFLGRISVIANSVHVGAILTRRDGDGLSAIHPVRDNAKRHRAVT